MGGKGVRRSKKWIQRIDGEMISLPFTYDMFEIRDIFWSLAHTCRYMGRVKKFYSVAEHSVMVSRAVYRQTRSTEAAFLGLLHDAGESFTGDLPGPLRDKVPYSALHRLSEEVTISVVLKYWNLSFPDDQINRLDDRFMREVVADVDHRAVATEYRDAILVKKHHWPYLDNQFPLAGVRIRFLDPEAAYTEILSEFIKIIGKERWNEIKGGDGE